MVRPGGTVVLAGVKGFKAVDNFVSDLVVMKEINIKGAIGVTSSGYKAAIRLIESGRVPMARMRTHDFAPPAPRMKDAIGLIRAAFAAQNGGGLAYDGSYYHVKIPQFSRPGAPRQTIPIAIAAVNRGMVKTAAAVADGLVGHPIYTRKYIAETVLPLLDGSRCELLPYVIASVSNDPIQARNEARMQIAFYYTTRLYHSVLEPHGWQAIGETIAAAFRRGDFPAMAAAVPDEMVDAIAITGRPDEVRDRVKQWNGLCDHVLLYSPSVGLKPGRVAENGAIGAPLPRSI